MLNAENLRDAEQRRFSWRCRRGMLELDIVLQDFVSKEYSHLNMGELQVFDEMLSLPDNEFWNMINSTQVIKKENMSKTEIANAMLQKLRAIRVNTNQEAE